MLKGPTTDGGVKRASGEKPSWKEDPTHEEAMRRHLHRYDIGDLEDRDSGVHPLIHVAWRALAQAWQETHTLVG
jgi:hypothetical protein